MTDEFTEPAELMGAVCGLPGYPFATIEHPISSATDAELADKATDAVRQVRELLVAGG